MIVCIAEDRLTFEPAVRLLLLSLAKHCADLDVHLFFPPASEEFASWVGRYRNVTLSRVPIPNASGLNVKPQAILSLMDRGHKDVVWIDLDILVLADVSRLLGELDDSTFVVTEEALGGQHYNDDGQRARHWGFNVGRVLPFAVNSGIIRATTAHRALLQRWRDLLLSQPYRDAQRIEWKARPWHMLTDQDVLTALLSAAEFSDIPIKVLKRGTDITQFFGHRGYTVAERILSIFNCGPKFIHSQGDKPWTHQWNRTAFSNIGDYLREIYLDVSPYTLAARKYRSELKNDTGWMEAHFALSNVLRAAGLWYPPLVGLPLAVMWDLGRTLKRSSWRSA